MNGRARTHAATACCRRVGSTCLRGVPPRPSVRARCRSTRPWTASRPPPRREPRSALRGLLDERVDRRRRPAPRSGRPAGTTACLELLAEDLQLRVLGELAGLPGGLDGRQVADLVVERLLGLRLAQPLDVLPGAVGVVGVVEDREVAAADERRAGRAVRAGQRRDGVLLLGHAGVLDQAGVPRAGDEGAVRAVGEAALELAEVEQPGLAETLVEVRRVVVERLGHLGRVDRVLGALLVGERGAVGPGERQHRLPRAGLCRAGG